MPPPQKNKKDLQIDVEAYEALLEAQARQRRADEEAHSRRTRELVLCAFQVVAFVVGIGFLYVGVTADPVNGYAIGIGGALVAAAGLKYATKLLPGAA